MNVEDNRGITKTTDTAVPDLERDVPPSHAIDYVQEILLADSDRQAAGKGQVWWEPVGRHQAELGTHEASDAGHCSAGLRIWRQEHAVANIVGLRHLATLPASTN
jgi:hypothetical protein